MVGLLEDFVFVCFLLLVKLSNGWLIGLLVGLFVCQCVSGSPSIQFN